LTVTLVKGLQKTDTTLTIFFAQCLIGFWLVLLPAGAAGHSAGMGQSLLLVAIGLASTTGQLLLTEGYRYVTVSTGSVLTMLGPVLTLAAGAFLFHEHFSSLMVLGAALVLGSCVMMTVLSGSEPPAVVRVPGVGQMGGGG
jgi:drug/metabolite transporter (DMT)-like permease